ncbi:MAG TPA: hypothetical protein VJ890_11930 [Vineibacter sp.]|nr:hypothetical protein [Vineibacter sp.]
MSAPPASDERSEAAVAADLLAHGASVHLLSAALTVAAVVATLALAITLPNRVAMALASLAAVAGIAETWFALRVGFDARIFRRLSRGADADGFAVSSFDASMAALGLMPAGKAGRPIAERARGAMRLLGRQVALLLVQVVLLLAAGWVLAATRGT